MTDSAIDTSSSYAGKGGEVTFTGTESVTLTQYEYPYGFILSSFK